MNTLVNDFHNTEYRTTKTWDEIDSIELDRASRNPFADDKDKAWARRVLNKLCPSNAHGCCCTTSYLGERGGRTEQRINNARWSIAGTKAEQTAFAVTSPTVTISITRYTDNGYTITTIDCEETQLAYEDRKTESIEQSITLAEQLLKRKVQRPTTTALDYMHEQRANGGRG